MVKWWKDRDEWMPGADPPPRADSDEERLDDENIGDVADEPDEFDDSELPERGLDE